MWIIHKLISSEIRDGMFWGLLWFTMAYYGFLWFSIGPVHITLGTVMSKITSGSAVRLFDGSATRCNGLADGRGEIGKSVGQIHQQQNMGIPSIVIINS